MTTQRGAKFFRVNKKVGSGNERGSWNHCLLARGRIFVEQAKDMGQALERCRRKRRGEFIFSDAFLEELKMISVCKNTTFIDIEFVECNKVLLKQS